jgi:6-phosphogluconolactonase (cycloisomerase 2 family)
MDEQKVVIARILRKYTLSLDADFKVEKKISVVMRTKDGMYLKVSGRRHEGLQSA